MKVQVYKLDPRAKIPKRNLEYDAGSDIFSLEDVFIPVGTTALIKTGIAVNIPAGFVGKIFDRSSLGKKGLSIGAGVIDTGYAGPINIVIHNVTSKETPSFIGQDGYQIKAGDKIAQLVLMRIDYPVFEEVSEIWNSERGERGFGSSGR